MNLIKTNNEKRSSGLLGVFAVGLALSLVLGLAVVRSYSVGSGPQNTTQNGDINVTNNYSGESQDSDPGNVGALSGAAVSPTNLDAGEWTAWNDGYFDDLELNDDLWVAGDLKVTGTVNLVAGMNLSKTTFNSNTTTYCAVQNSSGSDRVIPSMTLISTGSSGSGGATAFRGYVSAGRADNNSAATATIFSQIELPVTATGYSLWGGPVPGSYYSSSTLAVFRTSNLLATTTPVLWRNGWYANVTSTAITSSTGQCLIPYYNI